MVRAMFALALIALVGSTYGFPDGAPVDVCALDRDRQPHHGSAKSQAPETSPYAFTASAGEYSPGSRITVTVKGAPFKGFFLQARDVDSDKWIGAFEETSNTRTHHECAAITHADPRDKQEGTFIWVAPSSGSGRVYFSGTILKEYATFWSNLVARVA